MEEIERLFHRVLFCKLVTVSLSWSSHVIQRVFIVIPFIMQNAYCYVIRVKRLLLAEAML